VPAGAAGRGAAAARARPRRADAAAVVRMADMLHGEGKEGDRE